MILYPLPAPIFTVITEVWPRANRAVVTNNSTVRIKVVLIEVVLIKGFVYFENTVMRNMEICDLNLVLRLELLCVNSYRFEMNLFFFVDTNG